VFTLSEELLNQSLIYDADLKGLGFLPGGMFERLVGKAISWSQDTARGSALDLNSVILHKDVAIIPFVRQRRVALWR
jgi:hypothetical protein